MIVKTLNNQTLIDITMQELGDVERLFELALMNGKGITDEMPGGTELSTPEPAADQRRVVLSFQDKSKAPGSADDEASRPGGNPGGIGYMQIGNDFKVS